MVTGGDGASHSRPALQGALTPRYRFDGRAGSGSFVSYRMTPRRGPRQPPSRVASGGSTGPYFLAAPMKLMDAARQMPLLDGGIFADGQKMHVKSSANR